jgi:hypothetical protein
MSQNEENKSGGNQFPKKKLNLNSYLAIKLYEVVRHGKIRRWHSN